MLIKRFLFAILVVVTQNVRACDKFALSSVDARIYKQRNALAIYVQQENFNLLDPYIAIDIIKANISELCEGMIQNLPRLETLTLINLNLTLIEAETFRNVPKLKHLSLSVNRISSIPKRTFNLIPNLQVLYLSKNEIETIEEGAFSNMPELKAVHLEHNKMAELNGNIFLGSPKISLVDFSYNLLKRIGSESFADLNPGNSVRALNLFLNKNEIVEIDDRSLRLNVPVNLHLQHNQLVEVPQMVLSAVGGTKLYLDSNNIKCADNILDRLTNENIVVNLKYNPIDCKCMKQIDDFITTREMKGEINIESTLFCLENYPSNTI